MKNQFYKIILMSVFAFFIAISCSSEQSPEDLERTNRFLAYSYAEDYVKSQLKSPSTAKFPSILKKDAHISSLGNATYRITSWVDSQNGFGAMIRSDFTCQIYFKDGKVGIHDLVIE
jgi:hypothetical protein